MAQNATYGEIVFHIDDEAHSGRVSVEKYDIKELKELLDSVDAILTSISGGNRPTVSHSISSGSVKNNFRTTRQTVIQFGAIIGMIASQGTLDGLDSKTAKYFETLQIVAKKRGYNIDISSSEGASSLNITPTTSYYVPKEVWLDTEVYLYGTLTDAGGKVSSNIHVTTDDGKNYTIATTREQLEKEDRNLLYKYFGIRARGKQKLGTGELQDGSLQLIELLSFNPIFDEEYVNNLIKKSTPKWQDVKDADEWVRSIRGYE